MTCTQTYPPPAAQVILRILAWTLALALLAEGCRGVWTYRESMDLPPALRGGKTPVTDAEPVPETPSR